MRGAPAIRRIDDVRFLVGSASQTAYFYGSLFGLDIIAYDVLETNRPVTGAQVQPQILLRRQSRVPSPFSPFFAPRATA